MRNVSEPSLPRSVTLLCRGVRLGVELLALLGEGRQVKVINSAAELAEGGPPADVIVVDVPAQERRAACEQVRRYHRGPLMVLIDRGDSGTDLPPDRSRMLLTRPFSLPELSVALAMCAPAQPAPDPPGGRLIPSHEVRARGMEPSHDTEPGTVGQAVPRLTRSWRERRLVRISIISIMAALLFMGAFALVNQTDPCGPGCDELTGAGLPSPSGSTVGAVGAGPYTTDPRFGVVGPTTTEPSVGPAADDGSPSDGSTDGGARISTTTAGSSGAPTPSSSEDPSRSQPSASTTAPTTSKPRASTTTVTATTSQTTTTTSTTITEP
jgi:hypothetical protein